MIALRLAELHVTELLANGMNVGQWLRTMLGSGERDVVL
jgi:hypothetical protein